MKLDQLKKGFWGYKKASVYEYITMMEEEFSEKLAEKVTEQKTQEEQYRTQIAALEKELNQYHKQIAKVREMVCGMLQSMDAQSEEVEMQIRTVKSACPRHNMTLFERNPTEEA